MFEEQRKGWNGIRKWSLRGQGSHHENQINYGKQLDFVPIEMGFNIDCNQCHERTKCGGN